MAAPPRPPSPRKRRSLNVSLDAIDEFSFNECPECKRGVIFVREKEKTWPCWCVCGVLLVMKKEDIGPAETEGPSDS